MLTPNLNHKSSCPVTDVTIPCDADCTCGAVLSARDDEIEKRTAIIRDCQSILADFLPPDGIDAQTAINKLLGILDGPRGLEVAPPVRAVV